MVPNRIIRYMQRRLVPFARRWHARAVSAQELAASLHESGFRVAKTVALDVDGRLWLAVLPAPAFVDLDLARDALGAHVVHLAEEAEFSQRFPDCETGAEPPFGGLYGLPVLLDERLDIEAPLIFRAGTHEETIELAFDDFRALEKPIVARISRPADAPRTLTPSEMRTHGSDSV